MNFLITQKTLLRLPKLPRDTFSFIHSLRLLDIRPQFCLFRDSENSFEQSTPESARISEPS